MPEQKRASSKSYYSGGTLRIVVILLAAAMLGSGAYFAYKRTRPHPEDSRLNPNTESVPPPGIAPFDPKPLMDKVRARLTSDKIRFAVLGDSKHASTLPAFIKFLEETVNPDFVLGTGDMVAKGGGKEGAGYYELLAKFDADGLVGKSMRTRPWWPAIGNHEVAGAPILPGSRKEGEILSANKRTGIENFKLFYNLENDYYSFTCRNCYFIALPFPQPVGAQIQWLENELKTAVAQKKNIFIFNHVPYYTIGSKGSDDVPNKETELTALFKKYGVLAVFSGHDHGYYRTVRNGIPYFVSAGGGAAIYAAKRLNESLPEDVYYYGIQETYGKKPEDQRYALHKNDGSPDKITSVPDQFLCYVDVNGDNIVCITMSVKGEKWDEIKLK
ncbi:MAG TPA: metallophosphoesterase [Planctomycetota bacterium]|nr:metallophosphoesterase [Planctomycetota bacterium]